MASEPSELSAWCIGGRLTGLCGDDSDLVEIPDLLVRAELIGAGSTPVCDPSNEGFVVGRRVEQTITTRDGCWCTCPLKANTGTGAPHLLPSGTRWKITVFALNEAGNPVSPPVIQPVEVQIDADTDYEADGLTADFPCGTCVDLKALLPVMPEFPPPPSFCDMVAACLTVTTNGTAAGVTATPDPDTGALTVDICQVSADAGNALALGSDGCPYVPPELPNVSDDADNLINVGADGGAHLTCADLTGCFAVTSNGTALGVTQTGGTFDILVLSAAAGNLLTEGPDGGLYVDCAAVAGCISADAGNVLTVGADGGLYAPTPSTYELADCEGTALATGSKVYTPDDGHLFSAPTSPSLGIASAACAPPDPDCTDVPSVQIVDGVMYEWQPAQARWVIVMFTPKMTSDRALGSLLTLDDAALQAAAGTGQQIAQSLSIDITNDDCVPWRVVGHGQMAGEPTITAEALVQFGLAKGAGDGFSWPANQMIAEYDTREFEDFDGGSTALRKYQDRKLIESRSRPGNPAGTGHVLLAPGATVTLALDMVYNIAEYGLPDTASPTQSNLTLTNFVIWFEAHRSIA